MRRLIFFLIVLVLTGGPSLAQTGEKRPDRQREEAERRAYEARLAAHPFAQRPPQTPEDLRSIPKKDRPDLAAEQDFLLTMDPATGTIPAEQLWEVNRAVTEYRQGRHGGEVVTTAWEERGPSNVAGRTRAIMFDPNDPTARKVWAGGVDGGLWYTNDITATPIVWTPVNDFWANLAVSAIAYDPTNPQVLYVGTGEGWFNADAVRGAGIFQSADGGATWTRLASTNTSAFHYVQKISVHPLTGDVYAATHAGLYRSQDDGATWASVFSGRMADIAIASTGRIYVAAGIFSDGSIWSSTTGNPGSFTRITTGTNGFPGTGIQRIEIALAPTDPNVLYAVAQSTTTSGVHGFYKTTDGGATWTSITTVNDVQYGADFSRGQAWYDLSLEVAPDDPNKVVVGGINVFRSLDGGASWTQVSHWYGGFGLPYVHADQHGVAFRPGLSDHVLFSNDGGVYATENLSAPAPTPVDRNTGYNVTQFYAGAIAPEAGSHVMLAGAQDNGTQRFDAAGIDATVEVRGGDGGFTFIDQTNSLIGIASYVYNNFYRSVNGGHSFPLTLLSENTGYFINYADYDDREDILFTTRDATTIWRVSGVSTTPSPQQVPMSLGSRATHFRVSPYSTPGTTTLFIGTEGGRVYKVTDAHATPVLTQINAGAGMAGTISCIEIGESENHLLVTISNYNAQSVWETVDGGTTWMNRTGNYPRVPVRWALFNPNDRRRVILATEAGVWETTDITVASPEWTPAPSFPTVRVDMLQWRESDQTVMAATHGRGVYTATFLQGTVANEGGPEQPGATHTLAASPNPFRNQSEVTLSVARAQRVRAEVFAIDGRRVAVLLDEDVAAGQRVRLSLDGQALPAGAYVVAVQGEDFRDQVRVTRVR